MLVTIGTKGVKAPLSHLAQNKSLISASLSQRTREHNNTIELENEVHRLTVSTEMYMIIFVTIRIFLVHFRQNDCSIPLK